MFGASSNMGGLMQNTAAVEAHTKTPPEMTRSTAMVPVVKTVMSKDGTVIAF